MALVDNMFLYFDKMSMASSLEVRVPFVDHDVVAFCEQLPDSRKVWLLRRKELLRRASRGLVDDVVIDKKKAGVLSLGARDLADASPRDGDRDAAGSARQEPRAVSA
jgi:asparagine synthase (glutamine-hydrolysing)